MCPSEEPSFQPDQERIVLRLELESGGSTEPPSGSIVAGGRPEERFTGWIELMAAVNAARVRREERSP